MARLALAAAALLLCVAAASAGEGCRDAVTGYSGTFGKRASSMERFTNQTAQWRSKGAITKVDAYYSHTNKCIAGMKMTYGWDATNARLLGQDANLFSTEIKLIPGEYVNKVQIKAEGCVEFLRFVTNKGRTFEIGNKDSPVQLITSYPNKPTGFLAAIRGYEEFSKLADGSSGRGPLRTLQFVWGNCNPIDGVPAPAPTPEYVEAVTRLESGSAEPQEETTVLIEVPAAPPAAKEAPPLCPPLPDMCAPGAESTSTAFCPVLAPFTKATCLGGCCISSGKCTSSSCQISGLGKEVQNTICYGLNPAIAIGASAACRGLACKLAVPGCTSDLLGGSCVGTVVDLRGDAAGRNPGGAKYIGQPCLDVTPSDKTLTAEGGLTTKGEYVAKLWSICDCNAPAAAAHESMFSFPKLGRLNVTDLRSLAEALKPGAGGAGLQGVMEAVKAKVPGLVVPQMSAANLTNALGFIGSLVGKQDGVNAAATEGTPAGALVNLVKGASAVAAASNSSNPIGALLGALAAKGDGNQANPLAGLQNLVSALAPQGADGAARTETLSKLLGQLSSGTAAAPSADLVGAVGRLMGGAEGGKPDLAGLLSRFKGANGTDVMKTVMGAINQGKDAAGGQLDVSNLLAQASNLMSKQEGAEGGAVNPLAFLGASVGKNVTLQGILDLAQKAGPVLQQLQASGVQFGGGGGGANPLAGIMGALGGQGGDVIRAAGLDANGIAGLATKLGPLLQNIGGGAGAAGGAGGQMNWKGVAEALSKAGPVLQQLNAARKGAAGGAATQQ
ncbi:hypothetical protein Rsub_00768 [Raphidocelis subcapitata]|uniref:Jacalin-type lectin domain-containing protein n=1 Tax=Raphidocelis subcapitata TaxID=307507 RepID=A0A2V0NKZ9_9CHLO|nr:hypothetical protein Rsub_00768 [Raphidocelis subcapitata]|eukprot:GBF88056.1 hypothetical protein Rsub_00768 [Raphidocelis subcapitata]